jgi:hypothetical protein
MPAGWQRVGWFFALTFLLLLLIPLIETALGGGGLDFEARRLARVQRAVSRGPRASGRWLGSAWSSPRSACIVAVSGRRLGLTRS